MMQRIGTPESQLSHLYDYIILGAGPAGLQLGYEFEKKGFEYLILESSDTPGSFFTRYPRHQTLLSINKLYTGYEDSEINLRWDWNALLCEEGMGFNAYSDSYFPKNEQLVQYLNDFAKRFFLKVQYRTTVQSIVRDHHFTLVDTQGQHYHCRRLIMATGLSQPYVPPIPGIEHAELYTSMSIDPRDFVNQRVLILGKGNAAFETADHLIGVTSRIHLASPHSVNLAWNSLYVGHLRAVNNNVLDTYRLKSQNAILDATIEHIEYDGHAYRVQVHYSHAQGEVEQILYDRVLVCTGFRFDTALFDRQIRPKMTCNDRLPQQTSEWESVNVRDLYFAGTLMQARDYRRTNSAFIHGFRYNVRALSRILACKYHGLDWPCQSLQSTAEGLTKHIIERVNHSSALWQQFGYLCDVIVLPESGSKAHCYPEVPVDYLRHSTLATTQRHYRITLEYGPQSRDTDVFRESRIHRDNAAQAAQSRFLHPVIRCFEGVYLISEHHVIEDLLTDWTEPVHTEPLQRYLAAQAV